MKRIFIEALFAAFISLIILLGTTAYAGDGIVTADMFGLEDKKVDDSIWETITQSFYTEQVDSKFNLKTRITNEEGDIDFRVIPNTPGESDVSLDIAVYINQEEINHFKCVFHKDKLFKVYELLKHYTSESVEAMMNGTESLKGALTPVLYSEPVNDPFTPGGFVTSEDGTDYFVFCEYMEWSGYTRDISQPTLGRYMDRTLEEYMADPITRTLLMNSNLNLEKTKGYPVYELVMPLDNLCILFTDGEYEYVSFPMEKVLEPHDYVYEEDLFKYTFESDCLYPVPFVMNQLHRMYKAYENCPKKYSAFPTKEEQEQLEQILKRREEQNAS